jgi:hypothetical protein
LDQCDVDPTLIVLHACVALPTAYCLLFEPTDARFDSRPPPVEPIVAHSDLPVEPIARPDRPSCRMRTLKSRIPRPVDRFISRSDIRPPVDEPIAHPDLRPCRMRTSQSRILRPTYLPASIPSASPSLASVSTSASAPTSLIGSGRCLYCGDRSCAKRWCVRYRDDLDTGRIRLDTRGRICLGHSPVSVVRMRIGTSQRACVLEAEKRVQRHHSLPASATASVNITPVPARVSYSVSSPAAGPALGPALVPFVTPPSLLPTNAVSTSSLSPSPSPIGSLPSPTCSDLASKHAKFERDYSLPASPILSAAVSAIRIVPKDSSFAYGAPDSPTVRSAASEAPWLVHGPSFTIRFTPMPAPPEPMVAPTPVSMFPYRSASSPAPSPALSPALPEPLPVPPPAFRPAPMPASLPLASTYKPDAIVIGVIARLPEWVIDALCKALESLEAKPSWVIEYALQFLGVVPTPDLYMRPVALLELLDWSLRAQGLKGLGVGWREYFATLR